MSVRVTGYLPSVTTEPTIIIIPSQWKALPSARPLTRRHRKLHVGVKEDN